MQQMDLRAMEADLAHLRRQNRLIIRAGACLALLLVALTAMMALHRTEPVHAADGTSILRARGLVITDENGVERVWIGAPLPNPPLFGKRYKRSVTVSGILLFDADGNERSGYVTNDRSPGPVFLSLDSVGAEVADFTAEAGGGVTVEIRDGANQLALSATQSGASIKLADQGKLVFQQPEAPSGAAKPRQSQ